MTLVKDEIVDIKSQLWPLSLWKALRQTSKHEMAQHIPKASFLSPHPPPWPEIQVWVAVKQQWLTAELRAGDPHGKLLEQSLSPQPRVSPCSHLQAF